MLGSRAILFVYLKVFPSPGPCMALAHISACEFPPPRGPLAPIVSGDSEPGCLFPWRLFLKRVGPCTSQVVFYTHPHLSLQGCFPASPAGASGQLQLAWLAAPAALQELVNAVKAREAPEGHREPCSVGMEGAGCLWAAEEVEAQRD